MSAEYIKERLFRSEERLQLEWGDLRVRLPIAYSAGIAEIGRSEFEPLGNIELDRRFKALRARFTEKGTPQSTIAEASDEEVNDMAIELANLISSARNHIDNFYLERSE